MKIAVLSTRYSPPFFRGGEERATHELKKRLVSMGHEATVYVPGFDKWSKIDEMAGSTDTVRIPVKDIRFIYNLQFSAIVSDKLKEDPPDVVLDMHPHLGVFVKGQTHVIVVATSSYGEAMAISGGGCMKAMDRLARRTLGFWADRFVYRNASRIICVSKHIQDDIRDHYGIDAGKITVIGNGVDSSKFSPEGRPAEGPGKELVVTYAGRLADRKNVSMLLEAGAILNRMSSGFRIKVIGEGEELGRLSGLARDLDIRDLVNFTGRMGKEELVSAYRESDVFVLPSRYEGMPLALLEAMSCGIPSVCAGFRGVEDIVTDGITGFIVKDPSPEAFAEKIGALLSDGPMRKRMSEEARKTAIEKFSWDIAAKRVAEVLEDSVETGQK